MGQSALKLEEPQGEWLSESEIAKRVKLHRQTVVSRLEDLGREPDEERSHAKLKVYWFDDELQFAILNAKDKYAAVKYRDTKASAELKELKLAEAREELVPKAEVIELSQELYSNVYKEFGVSLPKRVAGRLAKAKTAAEVTKILKLETEKSLKKIREIDI